MGGVKNLKKIMVAIIVLMLLGCQSLKPDQSMASSTGGALSTMTSIEKGLFSVQISLPKKVGINEEFTVKADFKIETEQKFSITSRNQLFVYLIKDSSGKQINSYAVTDGGVTRDLSGETVISENYKYKIKKPGIYEISAVAEFTVNKDGSSKSYTIETDHKKIEVTE